MTGPGGLHGREGIVLRNALVSPQSRIAFRNSSQPGFWQEGNGSEALFDISATGAVPFWMPLMIFAFLFGLSMDYEVFILSRMRAEYDRTGTTDAAVIEGLGRTGRLVTSAALILFLASRRWPRRRPPT